MPKIYSAVITNRNKETHQKMGVSEHQVEFQERKNAIASMLKDLCPEAKGGLPSFLLREEDGSAMKQHIALRKDNEQYAPQTRDILDFAVAFFEKNPKGKLQIFSPEDGKPHYLTMNEDKSQLVIGDEIARTLPAPQKPSLWDRVKSIFTKVPSVETYRTERKAYDKYKEVSNRVKGYAEARAAAKAAKEAAKKAVEELQKEEKKEKVVEESKVAEKVSGKRQENTFENIQPRNAAAQKFFIEVDAAVAKNGYLKGVGLWAKKGMNAIGSGPQLTNSFSKSRGLKMDDRIVGMASITAFNLMQKYPYLLEQYKGNPSNLINRLADPRNPEFLDAAGINTQEANMDAAKWTAFVESGGMNIQGKFEKIATSNYIASAANLAPPKVPVQQAAKVNSQELSV